MKILRLFPFIAILLSLGLTSCNEDIDFSGDNQKTAIVYGLLDQSDSIHYIKITRAFGGTNNSIDVALIPDSSYFPVMTATVSEEINGQVTRSWVLDDTTLTNKVPGAFYSPEQKVYFFKTTPTGPLLAQARYKLDINVNNGEFHVYGETELVKNLELSAPVGFASLSFANSNVAVNGYKTATISTNPGTSQVIDTRLEVFFNEYFSGVPVEKSFIWKLGELSGVDISNNSSFTANGETFYELVKQNVTNDLSINKRELTRIKIRITGGTEALSKYLIVNQPSSSLAQNKPSFTNLTASEGARAIGLFSARHTVVVEKLKWVNSTPYPRAIDANSIRELATGIITGGYAFCSDHPNDAVTSYYCD